MISNKREGKTIKMKEKYIEDTTNALIELKMSLLKEKPHYKKYLDIRKKTDAIVNRMLEYHAQDNYNFDEEFKKISEILSQECTDIKEDINLNWQEDKDILFDMILFKNAPNVKCITSEFLSKKLYKNEEEKKLLECILKSNLSIYKVIKNYDNGFIEIQDMLTNKRIKIMDVASSLGLNNDVYMINRIISYNGISFGTGINLITKNNNKEIDFYLKNNTHKKSKITIIMEVRDIIREQNKKTPQKFMYHYYSE